MPVLITGTNYKRFHFRVVCLLEPLLLLCIFFLKTFRVSLSTKTKWLYP